MRNARWVDGWPKALLLTVLACGAVRGSTAEQGRGQSLKAALEGQPFPSEPSCAEAETPHALSRWSPLYRLTTVEPRIWDWRMRWAIDEATVDPDLVAEIEKDAERYRLRSDFEPGPFRLLLQLDARNLAAVDLVGAVRET